MFKMNKQVFLVYFLFFTLPSPYLHTSILISADQDKSHANKFPLKNESRLRTPFHKHKF